MFDYSALESARVETQPFPYIVADGLWNTADLRLVPYQFRGLGDVRNDTGVQVKHRSTWASVDDVPESAQRMVSILNGARLLRILSRLTCIPNLIPDPYFAGGGLNESKRGGQLAIHVDGTHSDAMKLHRRVNVIVYLNEGWKDEWGGHLELWSDAHKEPYACVKKIAPLFNRTVIFPTNDYSWHGHPKPLACPEDVSRKSLILYYYTATRPTTERWNGDIDKQHSAIFRPGVGL
jgi:hypothetical protein